MCEGLTVCCPSVRQGSSDSGKKFSIAVQDYERNLSVLRKERDNLHEEVLKFAHRHASRSDPTSLQNSSLRRALETTTKKLVFDGLLLLIAAG